MQFRRMPMPWPLPARQMWPLLALCLSAPANRSVAVDWPQWGGPQRDLVWREEGIVDRLSDGHLPRKWSAPIGAGYAGPAVAEGRVFVTDRDAEDDLERVHALDAESGELLWTHSYAAPYHRHQPIQLPDV